MRLIKRGVPCGSDLDAGMTGVRQFNRGVRCGSDICFGAKHVPIVNIYQMLHVTQNIAAIE